MIPDDQLQRSGNDFPPGDDEKIIGGMVDVGWLWQKIKRIFGNDTKQHSNRTRAEDHSESA